MRKWKYVCAQLTFLIFYWCAILFYSVFTPIHFAPLSIDVTEVQIFIIAMYLLGAVGGTPFWQHQVMPHWLSRDLLFPNKMPSLNKVHSSFNLINCQDILGLCFHQNKRWLLKLSCIFQMTWLSAYKVAWDSNPVLSIIANYYYDFLLLWVFNETLAICVCLGNAQYKSNLKPCKSLGFSVGEKRKQVAYGPFTTILHLQCHSKDIGKGSLCPLVMNQGAQNRSTVNDPTCSYWQS